MPIEWPWKRWARERRESEESLKWLNGQQRALEAGEEIEPPWVLCPSEEPWWGGWRQGYGEAWLLNVWLPSGQSWDVAKSWLILRSGALHRIGGIMPWICGIKLEGEHRGQN